MKKKTLVWCKRSSSMIGLILNVYISMWLLRTSPTFFSRTRLWKIKRIPKTKSFRSKTEATPWEDFRRRYKSQERISLPKHFLWHSFMSFTRIWWKSYLPWSRSQTSIRKVINLWIWKSTSISFVRRMLLNISKTRCTLKMRKFHKL